MGFNDRLDDMLKTTPSRLVVGLDPDPGRLPEGVRADRPGLVRFLTAIVDATAEHVVGFKPNLAFYEALGEPGLAALGDLVDHIHAATDRLVILDAKRGDVGHTAERYAHAAYEVHKADAVTVSPYMGRDAVDPFSRNGDKGVFVLARTTNPGAAEVQEIGTQSGNKPEQEVPLYLQVAKLVTQWDDHGNLGLVAGATAPEPLNAVRQTVGDKVPLLVPGVGAQGGPLESAVRAACDSNGRGFLVAASRSVIYAGSGEDYPVKAGQAALGLMQQIAEASPVPNP